MNQFKNVFNSTALYDTMFFTVITTTKYSNLDEFETSDPHMYEHWLSYSKKVFEDSSEEMYLKKGHYINEFSEISAIGYGLFQLDNDNIKPFYRFIDGGEKEIVEKFFKILNGFRDKKLEGFLCGHNINGHHIPILCKAGIKYDLEIPKSLKNNLTAKPWENYIIDTVDLWRFTGRDYISLEMICEYLNIETEKINFNDINFALKKGLKISLKDVTKIRYEQLTKLYSKVRNM